MCYWRRLSKRSVDNNDFEYTDEPRNSSRLADYANATHHHHQEPIVSDSLSLFKALQVRHEPVEPARARQRAQQLHEIYAEDEEAQLVCYRHAEVVVFMTTTGALILLVLSVALTCCLRIRKLTRNQRDQFAHNRLQQVSHSLSPSLLSVSDALTSAAGSIMSGHQRAHSPLMTFAGLASPVKSDLCTWTPTGSLLARRPSNGNMSHVNNLPNHMNAHRNHEHLDQLNRCSGPATGRVRGCDR